MANNISKAVVSFLRDNWSRGFDLFNLSQDMGPLVGRGDSVELPSSSGVTINTAETGTADNLTLTPDTLTVNRTKTAFVHLSDLDSLQVMNGTVRDAYLRKMMGDLRNALIKDYLDYLLKEIAGADPSYHGNLDANALSAGDVNDLEASMMEQPGVSRDNLIWYSSPRAIAAIKGVADYDPADQISAAQIGVPMVRSINGIPSFESSLIPGAELAYRQSVATSAVTVNNNVATATVAAGHGFVAGQQIWTSGLTTNVPVSAPATISSTTATTIVYPLTAANGPLADGVGTIYSASSMALLINRAEIYHAFAGLIPKFRAVDLEGDAGTELQLVTHFGRLARSGQVRVLHCPD